MRRLWALAPLLPWLLSPLAAMAQNETVIVRADDMVGPWKITAPIWTLVNPSMHVSFGPARDSFCRMQGARNNLQAICFNRFGAGQGAGDVSLDGNKIHIAWGSMRALFRIDAAPETPGKYPGYFSFKLSAIATRAPKTLQAEKIAFSE